NPIPAAQNHRRRYALPADVGRKQPWRNGINVSCALRNVSAVAPNGDRRDAIGRPRRDQIVDLIGRDEEESRVTGLIVCVSDYHLRTTERRGQRQCSRECGVGGKAGTETRHDAIGGQRGGRGKARRWGAGEMTEWRGGRSWSRGRRRRRGRSRSRGAGRGGAGAPTPSARGEGGGGARRRRGRRGRGGRRRGGGGGRGRGGGGGRGRGRGGRGGRGRGRGWCRSWCGCRSRNRSWGRSRSRSRSRS